MGRNRVIYQSEALYVSKEATSSSLTDHEQLERVQSANYSFNITRQDINQYGHLSRLDSLVLEPPTVSVDFSYYLTDGFNERALGFFVTTPTAPTVSGNFPSGHMITSSGRNIYITTVGEGADHTGQLYTAVDSSVGIGNAFLSDYTLDLAVGSLPTVSVTMEGSNMNGSLAFSGIGDTYRVNSPAVNPIDGTSLGYSGTLPKAYTGESSITALRPGDVTIDISTFDDKGGVIDITSENGIHVQSASLSLPLSRSALQRLGSKFPFARTVDFPVVATLSVNGIVSEQNTGNLAVLLDDANTNYQVSIRIKDTNNTDRMIYTLKGCKFDSESISSSIGANKTVDLTFSTQIGGPSDIMNGVFVSGANTDAIFT